MAGCDKADRNRKSAHNVAYKASNKLAINKARKLKKHLKNCANKVLKVIKGSARAIKRANKQREVSV
ncbi:hypothetical protein UFOVP1590_39 [uncultured Caudovirales phage]|uniref:Uncharacterized protein n=1 Tax=uncultured Caudovirales phage TaxID=2100421 RepID=A0A6J5SQ02_9CAUD|nr:hypothetical protein UFOVP1590_39 [uncultured Caudovirales phage]